MRRFCKEQGATVILKEKRIRYLLRAGGGIGKLQIVPACFTVDIEHFANEVKIVMFLHSMVLALISLRDIPPVVAIAFRKPPKALIVKVSSVIFEATAFGFSPVCAIMEAAKFFGIRKVLEADWKAVRCFSSLRC